MKKLSTLAVSLSLTFVLLVACKGEEKNYVSIPSLIEEQVAHIDTSLYSITKYIYKGTDTIPVDTFYIRREDFRNEAYAFLQLPDLSLSKLAKRFNEESRYDELLKRVILTYTPKNAKEEDWQKFEVMIAPEPATGDKVTTILANKVVNNRKGLLQEDMLWMMGHSFQVTRIAQLPGEEAVTTTYKVIWNDQN
ncbi:MAG: hypothetical protein ACO3AY_07675 [Chitinophagaceae bacterium]